MKPQDAMMRHFLEVGACALDRRFSPRYSAVKNHGVLAWRVEPEAVQIPARMLNISNGGSLLMTDLRPEREQTVWYRMEEPESSGWVEASVVGVARIPGLLWLRKPSYVVRLRFAGPCPYDFFKSATHGRQLDALEPVPTLPEHDNRFWR